MVNSAGDLTRHTVCSALVNVLFYPALAEGMKGLIYISTCNVVNGVNSQWWANVADIEKATAISNCRTERTGVKQYVHIMNIIKITRWKDYFQRHMKDGNNYDDIEMTVGMRGSG